MSNGLSFRECRPEDLEICFEIEKASYPADEAASSQGLLYRQTHAKPFFRCAWMLSTNKIIGYICSTRCDTFTEEAMSTHNSSGTLLAIHSVAVAEPYRRQGFATLMMQDYIQNMKAMDHCPKKIVLLAKAYLLGFYVRCGFQVIQPSPIVHGSELWFDLEMDLRPRTAILDAFADPQSLGTGNPAAFVLLNKPCTDLDWMQNVAAEFNLSETAFVWPIGDDAHFAIRYFSPTTEIPLCGHATLASAGALNSFKDITFHARNDVLKTRQLPSTKSGSGLRITMTFPVMPVTSMVSDQSLECIYGLLSKALGISRVQVLFVGLSKGLGDLFIEVTEEALDSIGFAADLSIDVLAETDCYSRGVIICCKCSDEIFDFRSRFFAPKAGINEDPVTGSAHCALASYFSEQQTKTNLVAKQCSSRGGIIECEVKGSFVEITGTVVTSVEGRLDM